MVDTGQMTEKPESVSMEEILNSIRQAIGESGTTPSPTSLDQSRFAPAMSPGYLSSSGQNTSSGGDVLELTHPLGTESSSSLTPSPAPSPAPSPSSAALSFKSMPQGGATAPKVEELSPSVLSDNSYSSVAQAFRVLAKAVEVKQVQEEHVGVAGQTVDVLMKEIMRPFIRDWLNQNLPLIVERLVAKEIERLTQSALTPRP